MITTRIEISTRLFLSVSLRVKTVESSHVGSKLLDGTGSESVASGNQDAALVFDQPKIRS